MSLLSFGTCRTLIRSCRTGTCLSNHQIHHHQPLGTLSNIPPLSPSPPSSNLFKRCSSSSSSSNKDDGNKSWKMKGIGVLTGAGVMTAALFLFKGSQGGDKKGQIGSSGGIEGHILTPDYPKKEIKPTGGMRTVEDRTGVKITLFQYATCPFCCKVRAFLNFTGFNYDVVEVNSIYRKEVKWSSYRKVPIVVMELPNGEKYQLNDSSFIISLLRSWLINKDVSMKELLSYYPSLQNTDQKGNVKYETSNTYFVMFADQKLPPEYKDDPKLVQDERKWRKWVDDVFVHTLSPNIYRTLAESLDTFQIFSNIGNWHTIFSDFERLTVIYLGGFAMWLIGKRLKRRHDYPTDVREVLYHQSHVFMKEVCDRKTKFLGGDAPNLADISFYGTLDAIEGTIAFNDLCATVPALKRYYENMRESIGYREGRHLLHNRRTSL